MNLVVPNVNISLKSFVNPARKSFRAPNAVRPRPSGSFLPLVLRWPVVPTPPVPARAAAAAVVPVEAVRLATKRQGNISKVLTNVKGSVTKK